MRSHGSRPDIHGHRAVALAELLIVIGVVAILLSLTLRAVQNARAAALRLACANNLRQLGVALHQHHHDYGRFPPGVPGSDQARLLSWMVAILPYLDRKELFALSLEALKTPAPPPLLLDPPHLGQSTVIKLFVCPADERLLEVQFHPWGRRVALTSYVGISGAAPPFSREPMIRLGVMGRSCSLADILDGPSNTIMVGERPPPQGLYAGAWYPGPQYNLGPAPGTLHVEGPNGMMDLGPIYTHEPEPCVKGSSFMPGRLDNPCDRYHLWSLHPGGAHFLFADASVRFLKYGAVSVLDLASRSGGEPVTLPD